MRKKSDMVTECVDAIRDSGSGRGPWWLGSRVVLNGANSTSPATIWQFRTWRKGTEGPEEELRLVSGRQVCKAIDKLRTTVPHQWKRLMDDNCDIDTYECVMQTAVFGEVVYG